MLAATLAFAPLGAWVGDAPRVLELHQRLATPAPEHALDVALTLDACGGGYDAALIATLVRHCVPATLCAGRPQWPPRAGARAA